MANQMITEVPVESKGIYAAIGTSHFKSAAGKKWFNKLSLE